MSSTAGRNSGDSNRNKGTEAKGKLLETPSSFAP